MNLRITTFIAVSALAHGAVALWLNAHTLPHLALGGEARALRVALLPAAQVAEYSALESRSLRTPPVVRPAPAPAAEVHSVTAPHIARTRPNTRDTAHTQKVSATPDLTEHTRRPTVSVTEPPALNHASAQPHSSAENVSKHINAALKNRFARHFEYPWLARQRGWQGRVLLSLHIAGNGDLSHWKVEQTSGYRTLDQSALKAARHIEHLPQAERWLHGESLEVHLPVQYKLLDS